MSILTSLLTGGTTSYIKIGIIIAIVLAISGAIGYHYYTVNSLKDEIITLAEEKNLAITDMNVAIENATKLQVALDTQSNYIENLQDQREEDQQNITQLSVKYASARKEANNIKKTLSKHNLGSLSLAKPGLIENIINKGTAKLGREIEKITTYEE